MSKKIRELKALLKKSGCACRSAKGSHSKWSHDTLSNKLILSGKDGADSKQYQEDMVFEFINQIESKK